MYVDKFMRFLSIGIQNNLHHESSITDAKTGLFNHAYFSQRLEQEIAHVARHRTKAGLVMLDVDHFKNFNDTWGHLAGDAVLNAPRAHALSAPSGPRTSPRASAARNSACSRSSATDPS